MIHNALFMNQSLECSETLSKANSYVESLARNKAPRITEAWQSPVDAFVGDLVTVASQALDMDGDPIKMRMTFYGVQKVGCNLASCGDTEKEMYFPEGSASIHSAVIYKRAGRHIVRIEATDMKGHVTTRVIHLAAFF